MARQDEGAPTDTAAGRGRPCGSAPGWDLCVFAPYVVAFCTVWLSLGVYFATGKTCDTPCLEFLVPHWCDEGDVCVCHGANFCYASYVGIYWPERGIFLVGLTMTGVLWACGLPLLHRTYADLFALEPHGGGSGGIDSSKKRRCLCRWLDDSTKRRRYMLRWLNGAGAVGAVGLVGQGVLSLEVSFNGHAAFAIAFFLVAFFWHTTLTVLQWRLGKGKPPEPGGLAGLGAVLRGTYAKRVKNTALAAAALVMNLAILVLSVTIDNDTYLTIAVPLHEWIMIIFIFVGFTGHGVDIWHCVRYDRINKVCAFDDVLPSHAGIAEDKAHQCSMSAAPSSDLDGSIVLPVANHDHSADRPIPGSGSNDELTGGGGGAVTAQKLEECACRVPGVTLVDDVQVL